MVIKEITVERLKNLGNYESARLNVTAQIDENDKVDNVVEDLSFYLDYKLNENDREAKLIKLKEELNSGKLTEEGIAGREAWIEKYHDAVKRFNELEFI